MSNDYLPKKDSDLMVFANAFASKITAAPATYGLVAADATQIKAAADDFAHKFELTSDVGTRTEAAVTAKDAAKVTLTAILRGYAMMIKRNRAVTDEAKVGLGIGVYDYTATPVPAPTTFPIIKILGATPRQHELRFNDSATPDKKARPLGAAGLVLFCQVQDAKEPAPADGQAAQFRALATKSTFTMDFSAAEVGKTAYYYARWHTAKGLLGPWSQVASMIVTG